MWKSFLRIVVVEKVEGRCEDGCRAIRHVGHHGVKVVFVLHNVEVDGPMTVKLAWQRLVPRVLLLNVGRALGTRRLRTKTVSHVKWCAKQQRLPESRLQDDCISTGRILLL